MVNLVRPLARPAWNRSGRGEGSTAAEASGLGFELLLAQLEAFESRMNERMESLSEKIHSLKDQLKEVENKQSAKLERVSKSLSTLDGKFNELKKTSANDHRSIRYCITELASRMGHLTGEELSKHLEQFKAELAVPSVYTVKYKTSSAFRVSRAKSSKPSYGGNWIVFQHRFDGSLNFNRSWSDYANGFGDLRGEHWLGLDKLHRILSSERHELLLEREFSSDISTASH
uniref:Fibrinogen C-terminal domain-containing protein n=1 Tax=Anopheles farauti TaxID=69004 RepID=A0A182QH47_9DIPT